MVAATTEPVPEPPPAATATTTMTTELPATTSTEDLGAQSVAHEQSASALDKKDHKAREFTPGCGLAIFSTELGTQAKRAIDSQCLPPVIVRSDGVKGVVDASRKWQARFRVQCLCIFPGQGWTVNDLWDAADLHLDTPAFCSEMLTFISRDTYHAARTFADDWIRAYPERLAVVGSDMANLHKTHDPFDIVDKIYNDGERAEFPRTFLWHVAHMMRHTLLETRPSHLRMPAHVRHHHATKAVARDTPGTTKPALLHDVEATKTATRKRNREITYSQPIKLTELTVTTSIEETTSANSAIFPATALPSEPPNSQRRVPSHEWPLSANRPVEPIGNLLSSMTGHPINSPNVSHQSLRVSKSQSRNMNAAAYQQTYPQGWSESAHRTGSGHYPRQPSSGMSHMHSPRFIPANMAIGQTMMAAGYVAPYTHGPPMMPGNMASIQHGYPNVAQNGLVFHPSAMIPGSHNAYGHQPYAVRGVSMGDMTNHGYYASSMTQHHVDQRTSMPRRGSKHNANGTLYDPYNGTNSDFSGQNGFSKGRKSSHNDNAFHKDRPRNASGSGVRPMHAAYNGERVASMPHNGGRYMGFSRMREHSEDDRSITEDRVTGCHEYWIGPENMTVTELFVGDLPIDVHIGEVTKMFESQTNISPANVSIRRPTKNDRPAQQPDRCHAFVA